MSIYINEGFKYSADFKKYRNLINNIENTLDAIFNNQVKDLDDLKELAKDSVIFKDDYRKIPDDFDAAKKYVIKKLQEYLKVFKPEFDDLSDRVNFIDKNYDKSFNKVYSVLSKEYDVSKINKYTLIIYSDNTDSYNLTHDVKELLQDKLRIKDDMKFFSSMRGGAFTKLDFKYNGLKFYISQIKGSDNKVELKFVDNPYEED